MPTENKGTPQPLTLGSENNGVKKDFRQCCKYGKDCYQKNPMHHQKFRHPKDDEDVVQPENKEGTECHSYGTLPRNMNGSSSFCKGPRTSKVLKSKDPKCPRTL
jgi:hypothetical protein